MSKFSTEFPDLQVPAWVEALTMASLLVDESWRADTTASFRAHDGSVLWVYPADRSARYVQCGMFVVLSGDGPAMKVLADTDHWLTALEAISGGRADVLAGWIERVSTTSLDDSLCEDALAALNIAYETAEIRG